MKLHMFFLSLMLLLVPAYMVAMDDDRIGGDDSQMGLRYPYSFAASPDDRMPSIYHGIDGDEISDAMDSGPSQELSGELRLAGCSDDLSRLPDRSSNEIQRLTNLNLGLRQEMLGLRQEMRCLRAQKDAYLERTLDVERNCFELKHLLAQAGPTAYRSHGLWDGAVGTAVWVFAPPALTHLVTSQSTPVQVTLSLAVLCFGAELARREEGDPRLTAAQWRAYACGAVAAGCATARIASLVMSKLKTQ